MNRPRLQLPEEAGSPLNIALLADVQGLMSVTTSGYLFHTDRILSWQICHVYKGQLNFLVFLGENISHSQPTSSFIASGTDYFSSLSLRKAGQNLR